MSESQTTSMGCGSFSQINDCAGLVLTASDLFFADPGRPGLAGAPHGAHDGLPDVGPPMEGHPGRFPGAPLGMHGPHPIQDMGAPASTRPEQFAGSPSKGWPHSDGAHGPHAMPGNERSPGDNQSSPHDTRRGLAAEDEQPPQDAQGGGASGMTHRSAGGDQQQEQGPDATRPGIQQGTMIREECSLARVCFLSCSQHDVSILHVESLLRKKAQMNLSFGRTGKKSNLRPSLYVTLHCCVLKACIV